MSVPAIPLVRLKHVRVRVQQISRGISLIDARARLKPAHRLQKLAKTSVFTCSIAQEQKIALETTMLRALTSVAILAATDAFTAPRALNRAPQRTNARCTTVMSGLIGFATMSGNTERIAGYIGDATGISPTPIADVSAADLEAQEAPKSSPKPYKIDVEKQHIFGIDFGRVRTSFWKGF